MSRLYKSHGAGEFEPEQFKKIGENVIFESGVLIFHPENIELGSNIYVGHRAILKGYYKNLMSVGDNSWLGQNCFLHSAGGIRIGENVGVAPGVKILTSFHKEEGREKPILFSEIEFAEVVIERDADIGIGAIILPGVRIGRGAQIGAGAVVTRDVPAYSVAAGNPARIIRLRR